MTAGRSRVGRRGLWWAGALVVLLAATVAADPMRVLVVGGGPNPEHNQVAIESNVRYILKALPKDAAPNVLFADGSSQHKTVLYEEPSEQLTPAEHLLLVALAGPDAVSGGADKYRAPQLPRIDGSNRKADVESAISRLAADTQDHGPVLLYFTGHGSPARDMNLDNNVYDLWDGTLSVQDLAGAIAKLPAGRPVTLIMVQCFSGAFGNLLFENGDPKGKPVDRDIAGFFATVRERPAAGCTPEVNEAEYHDFTSYFLAALTGRDRVGRAVTGADYNGDGRVGMDEAYCYALIHDRSIDIPVCTSDVFLRRFGTTPDREAFTMHYGDVRSWATPAQRAALDALSGSLGLTGEARGMQAYERFSKADEGDQETGATVAARRQFEQARRAARSALLARWPDLANAQSAGFQQACASAVTAIAAKRSESPWRELTSAEKALDGAEQAAYQQMLADARLLRFVRLYKSVVLAHSLRGGTDAALKQRYDQLLVAEGRSPLRPAGESVASAQR